MAWIGCSLVSLALVGCGSIPLARATVQPTATPQDPRTVGLVASDLPDGLSLCPMSGAIDSYLQHLQADGSPSYEVTADQWTAMKKMGATAGWVQSYAQLAEDCMVRLGERQGPSAISFVIRFKDAPSAADAFASGFLSLRPEQGMEVPGLTRGSETQLTGDAWTYDQTDQSSGDFIAYWANHRFVLFLLTQRIPAAVGVHAAAAMNDRVH